MWNFAFYLVMTLFLIVCLIMTLLVLIQKGRGGGLASAFGGAGGNTAFGSKTGDVLTWATSVVFGVFLVLAVALNLVATKRHEVASGGTSAAAGSTPSPAEQTSSLPAAPGPEPGVTLPNNPQPPLQRPTSDAPPTPTDARLESAGPTTAPATAPAQP